jgi:hypothetical protein
MSERNRDATGEEYVDAADRALRATYEEPMSLTEYVDAALADPRIASHASKYLVCAIESMGTRTVIEEGKEKERYRFFDDPHNDGSPDRHQLLRILEFVFVHVGVGDVGRHTYRSCRGCKNSGRLPPPASNTHVPGAQAGEVTVIAVLLRLTMNE